MRQKSGNSKTISEKVVMDIRRATRKRHSSEEKIRIVLDGLRGEDSIAELCRCEGIAQSLYYSWSKRSSWRPARSGSPVIRHAKRRLGKLRIYGVRRGR
jgi:transposase-like protein